MAALKASLGKASGAKSASAEAEDGEGARRGAMPSSERAEHEPKRARKK